ncbi:MAG TPA: cyclase family protein [Rudaea sp.]|jgi:kynurenine formamidase|nr:cyclase family protein [Rudaea sp.]
MNHRVQFDFEIDFSNGGGIQGRDFRLDIAGDDISDRELADYLVADMRLLMVGAVRIHNKRIIAEAHKRKPVDTPALSEPYVDLSHVIENGTVSHRGLPAPIICDYLSRESSRTRYAPGTEFHIAKIEMVANTGTYIDCPFHRFADGRDFAQIGIEQLADIDAVVVRAEQRDSAAVGVEYFRGLEIRNRAVLVHTGWDRHWNTQAYLGEHPFLTEDAANHLRDGGAKLVGIDSMNIDDTRGNTRPVHSALLGAGILIAEHLCNLSALPDDGFAFSAIPPKFKGVGTFPVRAMARLR